MTAVAIALAAIAAAAGLLVIMHHALRYLIPVTTRQEAHALADEARARIGAAAPGRTDRVPDPAGLL